MKKVAKFWQLICFEVQYLKNLWVDFDYFFLETAENFILFLYFKKRFKRIGFKNFQFREKLAYVTFHLKKNGKSAEFKSYSRKWASDSATKNYQESVKIRIDGIFDHSFVDQCILLPLLRSKWRIVVFRKLPFSLDILKSTKGIGVK